MEGLKGANRHLFTDNYYTSVLVYKKLLERQIRAIGTIRKNRKFLPNGFSKEILQKGQVKFYGNKSLMAVS